ncbi:ABC transporter permease [Amycolatopsis sp. NBC_01480]|uniref:ABC transporter permease n=1 Tax=Amycolatopsis sp. NBC_01480 TaxID=2903562 RepID=UPI002E2B0A43|nr:ABC transporter permease [Amycolatopsis sp. NBC_01480]
MSTFLDTQESEGADLTLVQASRNRRRSPLRLIGLDRLSGVYALGLVIALFAVWVPHTFLTATTLRSVSGSSAVTSIAALALIVPLACGLFDLSVAGTLGLGAVLVLKLQIEGVSIAVSILASLLAGLVIGAVNGFLVVRVGVSSFIATLGMSSVVAALTFWITHGFQLVADLSNPFVVFGQSAFAGLPTAVWIACGIAAVLLYVTEGTTLGRYLYAVGGNAEAARLVGVRVDRLRFGSLVCSGLLAAIAGVVLSAQLGSSSADIGPPYLLPAFSAVLLGATQIKTNGRVNAVGTLVAVTLLATGIYGLQLAGAPSFIANLFNGLALIVAVSLSIRAKRTT